MGTRNRTLQSVLGSTTNAVRETTTVGSGSYRHRTTFVIHIMVSTTTQHGARGHSLSRHTQPLLSKAARLARGAWATPVERGDISAATPAWRHTQKGTIGWTLRATSPHIADFLFLSYAPPKRPRNVRCRLRDTIAHAS
jgi:hypothetical protein